jgi:hypothetical protein
MRLESFLPFWKGGRRRPANQPLRDRVILLWWGSFPGGGGTIGDYFSVLNLADRLAATGLKCDILSGAGLRFGDHTVHKPGSDDPGAYDAAIFVCGPMILRGRMRRLLRRYRRCLLLAIAISITGKKSELEPWFDAILERDSNSAVGFDLALAGQYVVQRERLDGVPAICLRGKQRDYGPSSDMSETIDATVRSMANTWPRHRTIDTVIRTDNPIDEIEAQFADTSFLVTTRLHGALFALRDRVPFVAIDQIRGGAKVARLMSRIGWPFLVTSEGTELSDDLKSMASRAAAAGWTEEMERARGRAMTFSREAMDASERLVRATLDR